jgi:MarR family transcriptional regulator for hemolysin
MDRKFFKEIGQLMGRTKAMVDAEMNRRLAAAGGPNWVTIRALMGVLDNNGLPQSQLADDIEVDPAVVSRLVPQLVQQGYLRVEPDAHDRRVRRLYITDAGTAVLQQYEPIVVPFTEAFSAEVGEADLCTFASVLRRMSQAASRLCGHAQVGDGAAGGAPESGGGGAG